MTNYYITNDPILLSQAQVMGPGNVPYTPTAHTAWFNVAPGDNYFIAQDVSGDDINFQPIAQNTFARPTITIEAGSTGDGKIVFDNFSAARLSPTISVQDGVNAPDKFIDLGNALNPTLNIGDIDNDTDGATIGRVVGSKTDDTVNVSNNSTFRNIELRDGNDTMTVGDDVTSIGLLDFDDGDDSIILGDRFYNQGPEAIKGGRGDDHIELGSMFKSNASPDVDGGEGSDTIRLSAHNTFDQSGTNGELRIAGGDDATGIDVLEWAPLDTTSYIWADNRYGHRGDTVTLMDALVPVKADLLANGGDTELAISNSDGYISIEQFEELAPCFTSGTMIETDQGLVAVEALEVGDLVQTRDHGLQPVRWVGGKRLDACALAARPNLLPVLIKAGALGDGIPSADLIVSPQHRILVRSAIAQRMFGASEVLAAAKHLCDLNGVNVIESAIDVHYFHILFDCHEVVFSNGAETESLYTGPQALKAVGAAAREEILALFPELSARDYTAVPARPIAKGRLSRKLVSRHQSNQKMLVS